MVEDGFRAAFAGSRRATTGAGGTTIETRTDVTRLPDGWLVTKRTHRAMSAEGADGVALAYVPDAGGLIDPGTLAERWESPAA